MLFLICSLIWNLRVGNSDFKKNDWSQLVITLVVPLKDIIDISFHWGIQSKCDGKCSGLGIVLHKLKVLSMYIPFGTLHKLRQLHKKCKVWMTKVVLRYVRSNFCLLFKYLPKYRTLAIISRGLYIFYPIFEFHIFVFKEVFFRNFCPTVWLLFKSVL